MKIAIHKREGSFSDRWIEYCEINNVSYKLVDCYSTDIINQLKDCDALMWHWSHDDYREQLFARQLILSVEKMGKIVFPDSNTCWHFDDKVGQKYLLEAINAPIVPSYVFYEKQKALDWIKQTRFPKVFKLRGGAGSSNVSLVKIQKKAKTIVRKAFGRGFSAVSRFSNFKNKIWQVKRDKSFNSLINLIKGFIRIFFQKRNPNLLKKEKGYVYFQDFIPKNDFDIRLVVIGDKCFGIKRFVRKNDFRASGSGKMEYSPELFDKKSIEIAFNIANKLKTQSAAFDFVYCNDNPLIIEISYAYTASAYYNCPGYWDNNLNWHKADIKPEYFIIEDLIKEINDK